jgi:hypothetical protein
MIHELIKPHPWLSPNPTGFACLSSSSFTGSDHALIFFFFGKVETL